jgi:hypothetical protein
MQGEGTGTDSGIWHRKEQELISGDYAVVKPAMRFFDKIPT